MLHAILLFTFFAPSSIQDGPARVLTVDTPLREELNASDPLPDDFSLREADALPKFGRRYSFAAPADGPATFTLHSLSFDACLVIFDESGGLLGVDDDGWFRTHSSLTLELAAGQRVSVFACSMDDQGSFEFSVRTGAPEALGPEAEQERALQDMREEVRFRRVRPFVSMSLRHS